MLKRIITVAFICLLLVLILRVLHNPHQDDFGPGKVFRYSPGNASDSTRIAVTAQLWEFQRGYRERNTAQAEAFAERLFSRDILVLGTMPGEINAGIDKATALIESDWKSWGDCRFDVDGSHVSASGSTAWFATIGFVRFDLSKFLVLPLRLSGVMVREGGEWKINYLQFQFDLDLSLLLLLLFALIIWLVFNLVMLIVATFKTVRNKAKPDVYNQGTANIENV